MGLSNSNLYNQPTARAVAAAKKSIENRAIQNQMEKTAAEAVITSVPPSPSTPTSLSQSSSLNEVDTFEMPGNKPKVLDENRIPDKAPELDAKILEEISKWDSVKSKPDVYHKNLYDTQRNKMASAIRMKTNSLEKAAGRKAPPGLVTMSELNEALLLVRHSGDRNKEEEAKRILGKYGINEKDACTIIKYTSAPLPIDNKHDSSDPDDKDVIMLK